MHRKIFTFLALCLSFAPSASYAALVYDESEDGDLSGEMLALGLGKNTIAGQFPFIVTGSVFDWIIDTDDFYFTLPANTVMQHLTFTYSAEWLPGTTYFDAGLDYAWIPEDPEEPWGQYNQVYQLQGTGVINSFEWLLAATAGNDIYRLFAPSRTGAAGDRGAPFGAYVNYRWDIDVVSVSAPISFTPAPQPSPVPEADSASLAFAGLALLLGIARKRSLTLPMPMQAPLASVSCPASSRQYCA